MLLRGVTSDRTIKCHIESRTQEPLGILKSQRIGCSSRISPVKARESVFLEHSTRAESWAHTPKHAQDTETSDGGVRPTLLHTVRIQMPRALRCQNPDATALPRNHFDCFRHIPSTFEEQAHPPCARRSVASPFLWNQPHHLHRFFPTSETHLEGIVCTAMRIHARNSVPTIDAKRVHLPKHDLRRPFSRHPVCAQRITRFYRPHHDESNMSWQHGGNLCSVYALELELLWTPWNVKSNSSSRDHSKTFILPCATNVSHKA